MKKLFTIFTIMTIIAVGILFTSCKEKGYCYCYSSSPYVDYAQMESQAAGMKTEADCQKYDHGSAGFFSCEWIKE